MNFVQKNKKPIIIILIALVVIGLAWYYTLGKPEKDAESGEADGGGGNFASPASGPVAANQTAKPVGAFPLRWGRASTYTANLQRRLNLTVESAISRQLTIKGYPSMAMLKADGVLGSNTLTLIRALFPTIGSAVAISQTVSETQYNSMITSKPA